MADAAKEKVLPPFTTFNFRVELFLPGQADHHRIAHAVARAEDLQRFLGSTNRIDPLRPDVVLDPSAHVGAALGRGLAEAPAASLDHRHVPHRSLGRQR